MADTVIIRDLFFEASKGKIPFGVRSAAGYVINPLGMLHLIHSAVVAMLLSLRKFIRDL